MLQVGAGVGDVRVRRGGPGPRQHALGHVEAQDVRRPGLPRPPAEPAEAAAEIHDAESVQIGQQRPERRPFGGPVEPFDRAAEPAVAFEELFVVVDVLGQSPETARELAAAQGRRVAHAGHGHQLALGSASTMRRACASDSTSLSVPQTTSVGHGTRLSTGHRSGSPRRAMLHALLDVGRIHLPDPAPVRSLTKHTQRELVLILERPAGDGRDLAAIFHRLVECRELLRSAPYRRGDPLASGLDVGADVVEDQSLQPVRMLPGVGHRDDPAHRRSDQGESSQRQRVQECGQIADLILVLVGAGRGPRALAMAAHVGGDETEPVLEAPGRAVERLGARRVAVHAHDRRGAGRAPVEIVDAQAVELDGLARRSGRRHHVLNPDASGTAPRSRNRRTANTPR